MIYILELIRHVMWHNLRKLNYRMKINFEFGYIPPWLYSSFNTVRHF